jgi:hypothetical protein
MAAVGGRMEAVVPRRSLFGPDYLRLAVLAVVSVAVHAWLISHTAVTARDGVGFARYALGIQSPESAGPTDKSRTALEVIRSEKHPPGYPAAVWITAKFVRRTTHLPLADSTLLATQLVSAIAALLLVVPTYLLGRMLFGRNVGFAAALLFQVLPVPAHVTSDGLTEATYLLAAVTALALGVRAVRRPTIGGFLLCGLATGACYLVRPEGLMVGGAVGLVAAGLGLTRRWPRDLALGRLTALAVGVALVAGPYAITIGKLTNKPTGNEGLPSVPNPLRPTIGSHAPARGPVFAAFWVLPEGVGPLGVVWPAVSAAVKETGQGLHYAGAALALFGLFAVRRRTVADPGLGLLVVLLAVNFAVVVWLGVRGYDANGVRTHYVSERHVLLIVLLGCVFAAAGLAELGRIFAAGRAARMVPAAILLLLVATALPATLKPLHANREGHKHAGLWLKEHLQPEDCLIDPFEWAGCYSEKTLHHVFPDPEEPVVTYVVVDDKDREDDHARLPRMKEARNVLADGRTQLVYHWPEDRPKEEAKVKVYKLVRPQGK